MVAVVTHRIKVVLASLFSLLWPTFLEGKKVDITNIDENQLFTHLLEGNKAQPRMHLPDGAQLDAEPAWSFLSRWILRMRMRHSIAVAMILAAIMVLAIAPSMAELPVAVTMAMTAPVIVLNERLAHSGLPIMYQNAVRATLQCDDGSVVADFSETSLNALIDHMRNRAVKDGKFLAAKTTPSTTWLHAGLDEQDKIRLGLEGFFLKNSLKPLTAQESKDMLKGIPHYQSFKQAYVDYTGDKDVTGLKKNSRRFAESLITTDWGEVVASAMNKALVRDYNMIGLNQWRDIADVIPVKDFKTQRRIRIGGYGNLPSVAERGTYLPLTSPTDEEATYVPAKRGGTEDLTLEMIKNDDAGAVQKIPQRVARAAAQTLHEYMFEMIKPSLNTESVGSPPNIYDGTPLYTTAHGNKFTAALGADAVALNAARAAMKKFAEKDNSKRLGVRAGFIITPSDLEPINYGLTMPAAGNANLVPTFAQKLGLKPIVIDYWTDATDWVLAAKREDVTGFEIGFLDGREDPELFVSDVSNSGSWFTNDVITYKLRHIYGATVIDWRAFVGSVVAG